MKLVLASLALFTTGISAFSSIKPSNSNVRVNSALSMASGGKISVRPIGIGSAAPSTLITNTDLESVHDTSDEWISTRTGISERRVLVHEGTRSVIQTNEDGTQVDAEVTENLRTLGIEAARV